MTVFPRQVFVKSELKVGVIVTVFPRQVFIKSELKVGVVYVKEGQYTEEEILENNDNSRLFDEFLSVLGDKVRLKGKQISPWLLQYEALTFHTSACLHLVALHALVCLRAILLTFIA